MSETETTALVKTSGKAMSTTAMLHKVIFGFIPCASGLVMLTMSLRALLYGDVMKWFAMSVWALVVASVLSLCFLVVLFNWMTAWCRSSKMKTKMTAQAFIITFISFLIALVVGMSYLSVDSDSVDEFDQNFNENFYNFTSDKMVAAYTKWMSIFLFTAVFSFLQFDRALDFCNKW